VRKIALEEHFVTPELAKYGARPARRPAVPGPASRAPAPPRPRSSDVCVSAVDHQTFMPPSTTTSMPVMYELSSEERNRATFATSSG
jgi:hypothetical protein